MLQRNIEALLDRAGEQPLHEVALEGEEDGQREDERDWKIASDAIAGSPSGRISRRKIRNSEAPSIRADSSRSFGMPMKKFRNKKMANGSPNAVWNRTRPSTVSNRPTAL